MKDTECKAYIRTYKCDSKSCEGCQYRYKHNEDTTENILRNLVPKECCKKIVNGRFQDDFFVDWESKEGKAVNEALLALAKLDEIKEIISKRDNAFDGQEFGASYCDLDNIIEEIREVVEN